MKKTAPDFDEAKPLGELTPRQNRLAAKAAKKARAEELKANLTPPLLKSKERRQEAKQQLRLPKKPRTKVDLRQGIEEFPVKMIKEVSKIKWSNSQNLTKKYITVLLFMAIFAIFFALIDWGLQALFGLMKIV